MRVRRLGAVLGITVLALLSPAMAGVSAANAPSFLCPHNDSIIPPERFPVTWQLGRSFDYRDGARTCSWRHQGAITYRCSGPSKVTVINVVGSREGRREFPAECDGHEHTIGVSTAYSGLTGDYHVHWHTPGIGWYKDGLLRVGAGSLAGGGRATG